MAHIDVQPDTFQKEVLEKSHEVPVIVDFWAEWCGPCRALGPVLERLADQAEGRWILAKVDTDQAQDLAAQYQIRGIPAVKAFKNGKVIDEFVGALPEPAVQQWLSGFVADEVDDLVEAADLVSADNPDEARAKYRAVLEMRPLHEGALLGLAEISELDEAAELVTQLPTSLEPDLASRRARILFRLELQNPPGESELDQKWVRAHQLAADAKWEDALAILLEIVKADRKYRDDGARKAMLMIFDAVGVRSDIADRWRDKLSQTIY